MNKTIEALFPLKGQITTEILQSANRYLPSECVGTRTLQQALGVALNKDIPSSEDIHVSWGRLGGFVLIEGAKAIPITTQENIDMVETKEPQEVTFILFVNNIFKC